MSTSHDTRAELREAQSSTPQRKVSAAERKKLVAQWRRKGGAIKEFALEHGVPASTMYQWVRSQRKTLAKCKTKTETSTGASKSSEGSPLLTAKSKAKCGSGTKADPKSKSGPAPKAAFTEVNVVGQAATEDARGPALTVTLRRGHCVRFEGDMVDPAWLKAVLEVVSAC